MLDIQLERGVGRLHMAEVYCRDSPEVVGSARLPCNKISRLAPLEQGKDNTRQQSRCGLSPVALEPCQGGGAHDAWCV